MEEVSESGPVQSEDQAAPSSDTPLQPPSVTSDYYSDSAREEIPQLALDHPQIAQDHPQIARDHPQIARDHPQITQDHPPMVQPTAAPLMVKVKPQAPKKKDDEVMAVHGVCVCVCVSLVVCAA